MFRGLFIVGLHMLRIASLFLTLACAGLAACASTPSAAPQTVAPAPQASSETGLTGRTVILVGIDGLRWDAIDRWADKAPTLRALAKRGVRAEGLIPTMPSVTFVNFYSIATGLYASHTGIVSNQSYSRSEGRVMKRADHGQSVWWGGEPIWATAEKQGVRSAAMFWLGSEAKIAGVRPTFWTPYDYNKPYDERVGQVLDWLKLPEGERPGFLTIYFEAVDSAEHRYGVGTPEEGEAIARVDASLKALIDGVDAMKLPGGVDFVVVSDHGMTNVPEGNVINLDDYISLDDVFIPRFNGPDGAGPDAFVHIFVKNGDVEGTFEKLALANPHMHVYRRENLPAGYHWNNADRTGDIVAVADPGWLIFGHSVVSKYKYPSIGVHGYNRFNPVMWGTFIAAGPGLREGYVREPFENVEVYGVIANLLGLKPAKTDGDLARVRDMFEK